MDRAPDTNTLISETQAAFEQVRQSLQATDGVLQSHISMARQLKEHKQREQLPPQQLPPHQPDELRHQVIEQVRRAQYTQGLPGKAQEPDPLTRFARQVRRSRQLV